MSPETSKTIIRHLKGIVAAMEKEVEEDKVDTRSKTLEKDINDILDGKWNGIVEHRMTIRLPLGSNGIDAETKEVLSRIVVKRGIKVDIQSDHARYCIVVFSK